ncbi:hypothetical protein [Burkholderia sp. MBR-1]|uniref:hypothetical protein n=1 Tax=Burkholderia sp. MBR-1 TaxID=2732364 RepID=UPI0015EF141A|nr:hypothetical protein [Burkholderia sp. MBR-1]QMI49804.1 hypothetical protein MBR110_30505 [Burkholderia sp. MBR-1]
MAILKKSAYRLAGLLLLAFSAGTWAWMLGLLANVAGMQMLPGVAGQWAAPGILGYPMIVSIIAALIGLLLLIGVLPLSSDADDSNA